LFFFSFFSFCFFFFFIEEKKRKKNKKKPTKKMSRSEPRERVYALIDGERDYQDKQAAPGLSSQRWEHEGRTTVAGSILMIVYYVFLMCQAWVTNKGSIPAMDIMRKVAAMAVRAMEQYPTPARDEDHPQLLAAKAKAVTDKGGDEKK
jgi:hypothetical protein